MAARQGVISASVIVILLVGTAVGALTALALGTVAPALGTITVALISGFVATLAASIVRYKLIYRFSGAGVDESRIPMVLLVNAAIASLAGSLAGFTLASQVDAAPTLGLVGALAGLLSGALMAMLMITYHTNPNPAR